MLPENDALAPYTFPAAVRLPAVEMPPIPSWSAPETVKLPPMVSEPARAKSPVTLRLPFVTCRSPYSTYRLVFT